jgi:hypothetical protein
MFGPWNRERLTAEAERGRMERACEGALKLFRKRDSLIWDSILLDAVARIKAFLRFSKGCHRHASDLSKRLK